MRTTGRGSLSLLRGQRRGSLASVKGVVVAEGGRRVEANLGRTVGMRFFLAVHVANETWRECIRLLRRYREQETRLL